MRDWHNWIESALFVGSWGGAGVDSKKLEKLRYFNLRSGDWILMKFDI